MNRTSHTTSTAANHMAKLLVRVHAKNQTILIRADGKRGIQMPCSTHLSLTEQNNNQEDSK